MANPMKAELDIKPFLKAINEFGIAEQQPCGVQVVEWVVSLPHFLKIIDDISSVDKNNS